MKIAILAKKGGVGKSTVTVLLYEALRQAGRSVRIHDWDAQGTSSKVLELLNEGAQPADAGAEIVLYDTPPNLEHTATSVAVMNADIALVITTPSPADVWEANEAMRFAAERQVSGVRTVIFNKVRKATILGRLVDQGSSLDCPVLGARLSSRECYQHALVQGWKALDSAAREEVLQLGLAVLSLERGGESAQPATTTA
jgi:MinD-like ATPase involved in chromosome partitioning or flagellar assembly